MKLSGDRDNPVDPHLDRHQARDRRVSTLALTLVLLTLAASTAAHGYQDADGDKIQDSDDNCKFDANVDQADVDLDGFRECVRRGLHR